ncbi:hypothetical protein AA13595_2674 [Gluconacetobacter johannae DSM 13595]|uniref:DUF4142 domain-containing protein n=1 Tax=Gluconacetobacter johannae TaxID=112140 RepID=A0A7W4P4H4_9PROT|nr:DUF4142 domain-containing protein [Gluconacetobacter johannae]MBB2176924.1 DUF4142 domain-containing protein [Gluconacetobacter johannae]GBQ89564.1 hypothetical protein AA13595_2674 [Gluconacetobacter johannae DSM 13595]
MKTYARWLLAASILPLAACAEAPKAPPAPPPPPPLAAADATFVEKASVANTFEIATGRLADSRSHNAKVKAFAARLVTDHSANQDRLGGIATQHGVTLPTDLSTDEEKTLDELKAETGRKFDRDFLAVQVQAHTDALPLFQAEAQNTTDADLKSYAADTAAAVQSHLNIAQNLSPPAHPHRGRRHHH